MHTALWGKLWLKVSREEAERRIKEINEPYKMEILESIVQQDPSAPITIYHIGEKDHPMHWYAWLAAGSLP
jgi:threonyl-tRNA synthetase